MLKNNSDGQKSFKANFQCKLEICSLALFFYNMRIDYLLTNFIEWYSNVSKQKDKKSIENETKNDSILTVIPDIAKTGIESID